MNYKALIEIIVLAMGVSVSSITVAKSGIFKTLRELAKRKNDWFHGLISCHYCASHWIAAFFILIYRPTIISLFLPIDLLVSTLIAVCFSTIISGIILKFIHFTPDPK